MDRKVNRIKLYVKETDKANIIKNMVTEELLKNNFVIDNDNYDMAISIGGDGTFLKMVHSINFNRNIYYASINAGSLGFLSSIESDNIKNFINSLNTNDYQVKELNLLRNILYSNNSKKEYFAVNELTIRKSDFTSLRCDVLVNDRLLENYNGDGLVVSTPVGSTGYNLALGGPIIDNDIKAYLLSSVAPINNKVYKTLNNPIVLSNNKVLTVIINNTKNLCILIDGKIIKLDNINKIECMLLNDNIKYIVPNEYNYINNIKTKLIDNN